MRIFYVLALMLAFLMPARPASAGAIDNLRETFINCVEDDFHDRLGAAAPNLPNIRALVEQAFMDCQTEEMAYLSGLASALAAVGNRNAPIDAAAAVGRVKLGIKGRLVF